MEKEEILEKCRLTDDELEEFNKQIEQMDHKEDHARAYRTLSNPIRRDILEFIECEIKSFEEIQNELEIKEDQLRYHLSMLEQLNFLMDTESGWKATPRGIGFLYNAKM
ncbi:MAG: ArsR family transcriptional regulator [Promethearchaeota archaeon]|nr:MAG: ArsR family transcriptional regulator [Candidatus Lokiarchaeota archaeon]